MAEVNFQSVDSPDVQLLGLLRSGKSYEAAAASLNMTINQANYRASLARKLGMKVSPRDYRNAVVPNVRAALNRLDQCDQLLRDVNRILRKHRRNKA